METDEYVDGPNAIAPISPAIRQLPDGTLAVPRVPGPPLITEPDRPAAEVFGTAVEDSTPNPDGTYTVQVQMPKLIPPGPPAKFGIVVKNDWNPDWQKQLPKQAEPRVGETPDFAALDHPYVGGKFTLFVLGFGDHLQLLERCIVSIMDTCPSHRYDLRVALNQPTERVRAFAQGLVGSHIRKLYVDRGDRRKYPAMREMFWDKECPVETPYLCWFDDDSWCRRKDWMPLLAESIKTNHPNQGRLYGARMFHDLMGVTRPGALRAEWFKQAEWWKGKNLYTGRGDRLAPNGSQIVFASGGFWALATQTMREASIPDRRLNHNGGDCTIGCQVTQAGYKVVDFSPRPDKAVIAWSDAPRRGFREPFPWA